MLYIFLMLVLVLLFVYVKDSGKSSVQELNKEKTSPFIITCILSALTIEGVLTLNEESQLQDYSLPELEQLVLNEKGLSYQDWSNICYEAVPDSSFNLDMDSII